MKFRIVKSSRLPHWPIWAVTIVLAWLTMVSACVIISRTTGQSVDLCLFRKITTLPCPSCGATRGVLAFLSGNFIDGFLFNPLLFLVFTAVGAEHLARLILAKTVKMDISSKERLFLWIAFLILFTANWAYIIIWIK